MGGSGFTPRPLVEQLEKNGLKQRFRPIFRLTMKPQTFLQFALGFLDHLVNPRRRRPQINVHPSSPAARHDVHRWQTRPWTLGVDGGAGDMAI